MSSQASTNSSSAVGRASARNLSWRRLKDRIATYGIGAGGGMVLAALLLIFVYLLYVVLPLFQGAGIERVSSYVQPAEATTLHLAVEEQNEIAVRFTDRGEVIFFKTDTGETVDAISLPLPPGVSVTSFAAANPARAMVAFGLNNGKAIIIRHRYKITYPDNKRLITPEIEFPLGEAPIVVDSLAQPLVRIALRDNEENTTLVATTDDKRLLMTRFAQESSSLFDDGAGYVQKHTLLTHPPGRVIKILINHDQRKLYVASRDGKISYFDIEDEDVPQLVQYLSLVPGGHELSALELLTGGISLLVGTNKGHLSQWFPVMTADGSNEIKKIREFRAHKAEIIAIIPEYQRKAFVAIDKSGQAGIYHATAQRKLLMHDVTEGLPVQAAAISPRANTLIVQNDDQKISFWKVDNEHPEISWSSLWGKVWYEGYDEPKYTWQSSSASNDFEPKFSLTPLTFGTLKAAFYAMLLAIPLAIMGAIFTAHFMAPRMRRVMKPSIEIMEALPTVILGFLAGLWLAPLVEKYLPGVFAALIILPFGILLTSYLWHRLPVKLRSWLAEGWEPALLAVVIALLVYISFTLSPIIEAWFFGGDMRLWLTHEIGIDFDQRNSLVVGLAMGFAVIPTIFSIAEDAIFAVPKHLVNGSLAMGATPWQTLMRVVLLTASPGIFSAVMIGFGRAVGETMIVLMATGNTPVMDFSIFQGMRTLAANIAVELPESEVASTHYRVLFLAALVLFIFTFVVNTLAELVRQHLRKRYSTL